MSDWVQVGSEGSIDEGSNIVVDLDNVMAAVFMQNGEYIAIEDVCPHDGSEIASGCLKGGILECPHHGATFELKTGHVLTPPAYEPLEMLEVRVEQGIIEVRDNRWD
ncbi:MAG: 3-phenylpropionate/trans-cinnamate dioxygenase ferredoxin subunit [Cryomorphaceae bacterium]|jgi:3-phenylpropionate/trans-cinnamate dioxygenase ferredoxin subunit